MNLDYYLNEVKYRFTSTTRKVQGSLGKFALKLAMGGGAASIATDLAEPVRAALSISGPAAAAAVPVGEVIMSSTAGLLSVVAGGGISAYMNHLEHQHNERQLCERYRDEIAGFQVKDPRAIGIADLKDVAKQNPTFGEELRRNDITRNLKTGAAIVGTLFAFAAVFAAITFFPPLAGLAAASAAGGLGATLGMGLISGVLGFVSLQGARHAITHAGNKLFGIDKPSPLDRVQDIVRQQKQEKVVTPAQVLGVFVAAQPELAHEVKKEFGGKYEELSVSQKIQAVELFGERFGVAELARKVNAGEIYAQELAFSVHGQSSGVVPDASWKEKLFSATQEQFGQVQEKLSQVKDTITDKVQDWQHDREISKLANQIEKAIDEGKELPPAALAIAPEQSWRQLVETQREQAAKSGAQQGRA